MKRKICFFTESYIVGGLDTFIVTLINNWPSEEDEITLMCNRFHSGVRYLSTLIQRENFELKLYSLLTANEFKDRCRHYCGDGLLYKIFAPIGMYMLMIRHTMTIYRKLHFQRFDDMLIINGGYPGSRLCQCASISWGLKSHKKFIYNFHNDAVPARKLLAPMENLIDACINHYSRRFVSVSQSCASSIINNRLFIADNKVMHIYNGISSETVIPENNIKDVFSIPTNNKTCLMLASYEERKGHSFLFKAFAKVLQHYPNTTLLCCGYGEGSDMKRIHKNLQENNIDANVIILDYRKDAMQILAQVDIVLIASQSFESFGLTAVEAMKYKKPIVTTNCGGLKEVVENGDGGYVFDINDMDGYYRRIVDLLNNPTLRVEQGEKGYQRYCKNFTAARMTNEYYNLINNEIV